MVLTPEFLRVRSISSSTPFLLNNLIPLSLTSGRYEMSAPLISKTESLSLSGSFLEQENATRMQTKRITLIIMKL
jgi:hypothetical protein